MSTSSEEIIQPSRHNVVQIVKKCDLNDWHGHQRNILWDDSECADGPGFMVLDAAVAPASTFVSEPQIDCLG